MKISRSPSARKCQPFLLHSICFDVSENDVTGGGAAYDSDADVFQHQIQLWSIFRSIVAEMVQCIAPIGFRAPNSHKLDISSGWPILWLGLGNLIGCFRLQFHIMKNSFDADNVLLNLASGPHSPILHVETERVSDQNHDLWDSEFSPERQWYSKRTRGPIQPTQRPHQS